MDWKHGERLRQHPISHRLSSTAVCTNPLYPVAREDEKRGPVEDGKSRTSGRTDLQKKMGLDWPHPQNACQQHHQVASDLESTGEEKERKIQEHMAQRHRGRHDENRSVLEGAGEDCQESGVLVDCCRWGKRSK